MKLTLSLILEFDADGSNLLLIPGKAIGSVSGAGPLSNSVLTKVGCALEGSNGNNVQ